MEIIEKLGIVAMPVIVVIVFLIVEAVKATGRIDGRWNPVIAGFSGGVLGVVAMYIMPEFPGADPLTAVAIGIVSGLAATGAHQVFHQWTKPGAHEE
jgi:hypothetical protein